MSTNDTVLLQATGAAGEPLPDGPARGGPAAAGDRDRRRRRGRGPGRPGRGRRRRRSATRPSGSPAAIANSPLVKTALFGRDPNWGRIAQAAGDGAGRRGPRTRSAPTRSTPPSSAARPPRPRSASGSTAATRRAHVYFSRPRATSTSASTRSTRHDGLRGRRMTEQAPQSRDDGQRRDAARGAALHPGVPRPHRGDQVRRRGDARRGPARGLRHRRRPAQVRRPEPGDRPRRRPRDHRATWTRLGLEVKFHEGLRVSDAETVEVAKMVLLGKVNSDIVQRLNRARPARGRALRRGRHAVRGRARSPNADQVGFVGTDRAGRRRRPQPHRRRLHPGDRLRRPPTATASSYNVNADEAAGKVAAALGAYKAIFLTDVEGWLADADDESSLISRATVDEVEARADRHRRRHAAEARRPASTRSAAAPSRPTSSTAARPHSLLLELFTDAGIGTMVTP